MTNDDAYMKTPLQKCYDSNRNWKCLSDSNKFSLAEFKFLFLFAGANEVNEATPKFVELCGGNPWIGAQLPRLLTEAEFQITYESPFILHGGPESSFFQQLTGESLDKVHLKIVEKGLLSKEALEAYMRGIDEMKANPHSRMYNFIDIKIVAVK